MKHDWKFVNTLEGPTGPLVLYSCNKCDREERIYLFATKALVEFLTADDCTGQSPIWGEDKKVKQKPTVRSEVEGCSVCAGRLVMIRGRYPGDAKRKVCPTCLKEKLEYIDTILTQDGEGGKRNET